MSQARAVELGGISLVPVTEIPRAGRFAVIQDPVGGVLGIYKSHQ